MEKTFEAIMQAVRNGNAVEFSNRKEGTMYICIFNPDSRMSKKITVVMDINTLKDEDGNIAQMIRTISNSILL